MIQCLLLLQESLTWSYYDNASAFTLFLLIYDNGLTTFSFLYIV